MKKGTTTLIGLLSALLLAALIAATLFLKAGRDFQITATALEKSLSENKELVVGLEKEVTRLEGDYREMLDLAKQADAEAAELADRLHEYDLDLQNMRSHLTVATNELIQARSVEHRLQQTVVKLNTDKQQAEKNAELLKMRVEQLEKIKVELEANATSINGKSNPFTGAYQSLGLSPGEIRERLAELDAIKAEALIRTRKEAPTAPPKIALPEIAKAKAIIGQIKAIHPEFEFVLLDIGEPNGVKKNDKFIVRRDGKEVGQLQVRDIRAGISICDIVKDKTNTTLNVGDDVELIR